jgi:hypothetical protein
LIQTWIEIGLLNIINLLGNRIDFFLIFPKYKLFQIFKAYFVDFSFLAKIKAEEPLIKESQAAIITEQHSGCLVQNSSNLKGLGRENDREAVFRINGL